MQCVICGKEIEKSMFSHTKLCSSKCFSIAFWNDTLDDKAIIIGGVCYHDGGRKQDGSGAFLGHGGREFEILMNDGTTISTNNLWCNGDVPKYRNVEDNAIFIKG